MDMAIGPYHNTRDKVIQEVYYLPFVLCLQKHGRIVLENRNFRDKALGWIEQLRIQAEGKFKGAIYRAGVPTIGLASPDNFMSPLDAFATSQDQTLCPDYRPSRAATRLR